MSWKFLHTQFPHLNGWQLLETELIQAAKSLVSYEAPPPPFFFHLRDHLIPPAQSQSRLRRFVNQLDFHSPTYLFWTALKGLDQFKKQMKPQWRFTRDQTVQLIVTLCDLLVKPEYSLMTYSMVSELAHHIITDTHELTGEEAADLMICLEGIQDMTTEMKTLKEIARAHVFQKGHTLDKERLILLKKAAKEELVKDCIECFLKNRVS